MMSKYILLSICFCLSTVTFGQGIEFFHGSWEEALAKATEEEKLIFVDAYTTWCGPCKRMAKQVFPDAAVGEYYNAHYVNLKLDMDKPEGKAFKALYPVSAFPTLYYIDTDGAVVKKIVGGQKVDIFLNIGMNINKGYDRSGDYAELYEQGNRDYDLVLSYIKALNNAGKSSLKVSNDYLRNHEDISGKKRAELLYESLTNADSRIYELFSEYKSDIVALKGRASVEERIEDACWNTLATAIEYEFPELLQEAKMKAQDQLGKRGQDFALEADYAYAKAITDIAMLNETALAYAKKTLRKDGGKLHDLCKEVLAYSQIDGSIVGTSEKIAKMAVDQSASAEYLYTYAMILHQNDKSKKALKQAQKALKIASSEKEKASINKLISRIKAS